MVGCGRAWRPERRLPLQRGDDCVAVENGATPKLLEHHREPGRVIQDVPHQDALLAVLRELGPVLGHRRVRVDEAPIDEDVEADARDALGDGHHAQDGVPFPPPGVAVVAVARPQIHHGLAVDHDTGRRADLLVGGVVLLKCLRHRRKAGMAPAVELVLPSARREALVNVHCRADSQREKGSELAPDFSGANACRHGVILYDDQSIRWPTGGRSSRTMFGVSGRRRGHRRSTSGS